MKLAVIHSFDLVIFRNEIAFHQNTRHVDLFKIYGNIGILFLFRFNILNYLEINSIFNAIVSPEHQLLRNQIGVSPSSKFWSGEHVL